MVSLEELERRAQRSFTTAIAIEQGVERATPEMLRRSAEDVLSLLRRLRAAEEVVEAAERVNGWWVMRSMREGVPLDGETGEARAQAKELDAALSAYREAMGG